MNNTPDPAGSQRTSEPTSAAGKASRLATTHTVFRIFILTVVGSFFIFQLDVTYLWIVALLTAASIVLGILLLVRVAASRSTGLTSAGSKAMKSKESRLVLIGTIFGLVVSSVMALLVMVTAMFFGPISEYQECARSALTQKAAAACRVQLEESLPSQAR